MAKGLEFKEDLSIISGGYPGEGTGSDGVTQDWTETSGNSGSSTVTYYYHDSATTSDANSTIVYVTVTDEWTAVKRSDNTYEVTVHSTLDSIRRERRGSPSPLSVSIFVRRERGGANIWTSGGCVSATANATHATDVDLGTYTIILPPGQPAVTHGAIYYRSNICGYDSTNPPSIYVDEYWLGINFRNTLPPDYRPGKIRSLTGESTQIAEGTSISVDNTLDKPFAEVQLNGDSEQTASPTPANPSTVQTVTGTQTVTVSNGQGQSQSYTIDLGSYELCSLGSYKDYIYQSGTSWFIHKATGVVDLSTLTWTLEDTKFKRCQDVSNIKYVESDTELGEALAEDYLIKTDAELTDYPDCLAVGTDYVSVNVENDTSVTPSGLLYYVLDTPGDDREILEPTLVAQLNALKAGGSFNGQTAITVSGNLAAPLRVGIRVYSGTPTWSSHNRETGWAGVWDGSTYKEMRTEGGPTDTGNPPTIFHDTDLTWHNQRKIGAE